MHDEFLRKLKLSNNFELFYELVVWGFGNKSKEIDLIKEEIELRKINGKLIRFGIVAFIFNFSSLYAEALYNDRWEFFEVSGKKAILLLLAFFLLKICLLIFCINQIIKGGDFFWKILFSLIFGIFTIPHLYKTITDLRNYKRRLSI
ncbi:MAG: hypothetical protein KDB99_10375 [Chitinophagaceae bacterium]|nr:hypothetical protein [Chitinophagaceae bacterium]